MRRLIWLATLPLIGCTGGPEEEDCWWCDDGTDDVDTDDETDTDDKDTDGKDTDGKDTDGKDTDEKDPGGSGLWSGVIQSGTGLGTFGYESEDCTVDYEISKASEADGCGACDFAWGMTLGEVSSSGDCGGRTGYGGATIYYGHENPYTLWGAKGEDWIASGTSKLHEGTWYFNIDDSGKGGGK